MSDDDADPRHEDLDGHGHPHGVAPDANRRYVLVAPGLIAVFMSGEAVAAFLTGPPVLFADAGCMPLERLLGPLRCGGARSE